MKRILKFVGSISLAHAVFCSASALQNPIPQESFDDFKTLMMYFNEPLLSNATIDNIIIGLKKGASFEGANSSVMAMKLSETISHLPDTADSEIKKFGEYLAIGNEFLSNFPKQFDTKILIDAQKDLVVKLESKTKIVLPFGWTGTGAHAIGLVLELNENNTYNLAVINTGDGLQYHAKILDPKEVYHSLPRMWIEFKGIPKDEIFSENAWFMYVFYAFNNAELVQEIESAVSSVPHYFYGSILSNFVDYVQVTDLSYNKLLPAQRSGSCTLSSLMASYFYLEKDDVTFHKSRVIIGHQMLQDFIKKYENNLDFETLITDGFDIVSRNLWHSTSSALAHQLLSYLEYRFPESFKHAGLIGAERNRWIDKNKNQAVQDLNESLNDLELIKKTIDLALKIQDILKRKKIKSESRKIQTQSLGSKLKYSRYHFPAFKFWNNISTQINLYPNVFSRTIERDSIIIKDYASLYERLNNCHNTLDRIIFSCVRDTFESADNRNWWIYLENIDQKDSLEFLNLCTSIIKLITGSMYLPNTLDDIVTLAHLQIAIWKSAVEYDKTITDEDLKLNLENFSPPPILEDLIKKIKPFLTSGQLKSWHIHTVFAPNNVDKLKFLLKNYAKITKGSESFLSPRRFLTFNTGTQCDTSYVYSIIEKGTDNSKMYKKIFSYPDIETEIQRIRTEKYDSETPKDNSWKTSANVQLTILLSIFDKVSPIFPQYTNLINGMIWIYKRAANVPFVLEASQGLDAFNKKFVDKSLISLNYRANSNYNKNYILNNNFSGYNSLQEKCLAIKINGVVGFFYRLRHSQAKGDPENGINLESWLNYIKGSNDGTIYDDPYFMYLSNHLMNMPRLTLDIEGEVQDDKVKLYPEGFELKHIKEIFENFMRLISENLSLLIEKKGQLSKDITKKHVNRAINMAIPLTKFIVRIDYDQNVAADSCSEMLSILYKAFFKFGFLKNDFDLDDEQISGVNLVLTQICDAPIRNPKTFLNLITDIFPKDKTVKFRKSLARVHWFITKIYYSSVSPGKSHADDLFINGFMFYKVAHNEIENIKTLIDILIVPRHVKNPGKMSYTFSDDGSMIILKIDQNGQDDSVTLCIQLSSGKLIKNSYELIDQSKIINNSKFQSYFTTEEDRKYASRGEITKFGSIIVYIVNDYKQRGNAIAFLCESDNCTIYRKYSQNWYEWIEGSDSIENLKKETGYYWINDQKLYQKKISEFESELIVIKDEDSEPLNRIKGSISGEILFNVGAFESDWILLQTGSEKEGTELEKHLRKFTDTDTVLAKNTSNNDSLVVIYPGLRFTDAPNNPFILVETGPNIFEVYNVPGFIIETDQYAVNNVGISGTLVAKSKDEQRFILAPVSPVEDNPDKIDRTLLRYIEKIPIVKEIPAPQTRLQRLLLAFYCVKAREYNFARELLHPFISINQNEEFIEKEIEILGWITSLDGGGPEAAALKLMAAYHAIINAQKFPLGYLEEKTNCDTSEAKVKKLRSSLLSDIKNSISGTAHIYFGAIRDLPEKYFLHRIFPEILDSTMINYFKSIFAADRQNMIVESATTSFSLSPQNYPIDFKSKKLSFNRLEALDIEGLIRYMSLDDYKEDVKNYLNLYSKLIHRNKNDGKSTFSENEIIVLCASIDLSLYADASRLYRTFIEEMTNFERDSKIARISKSINDANRKCKLDHADKLKRLNVTEGSTFTRFDRIIETLKADIKSQYQPQFEFDSFEPVDEETRGEFDKVSRNLQEILQPDKRNIELGFINSNLIASSNLQKLKGSIDSFVNEKGQFSVLETELPELTRDILNFFKEFLKCHAESLNMNMEDLTSKLYNAISTNDSTTSSSHGIENLNRLMHQRKLKMFPNLYSCYQKVSVECIQNKFPQLNNKESIGVLNSTMKFFSYQVLLDYYAMLLGSINNILSHSNVSVDDLILFLDELEKINDFNDRIKTPSILNFEYRSKKYRLRSEQVKDIENLTAKDEKSGLYKSSVIQRMMAAGKTLVLGTISVVRKALDSSKLSILVPPSSLYQSNLSAMQTRTYSFFKTKGHNFIFPRFQFGSNEDIEFIVIPFLELILSSIESIKKAHDYYVLSPDSLQSFLNSYIEMINNQVEKCKYDEKNCKDCITARALSLYAKIYNIFRTQGSIILDEIDMTMDPKKELNFPTIENEPFNMLVATLSTDLIEHSISDDTIVENIGLDILGNNQSALTAKQYDEYREALFKYIEGQLNDQNSLWSEQLLDEEVPDLQKDKIIEFLRTPNMEYMKDWIQKIYISGKSLIANALVIVKAQIWRNFKDAFKGTANLNYGSAGSNRPTTDYSIPYLAANTPSPTSEFADRWETLNKTLLTLASVSCPERIAKQMINYIRKRIAEETSLKTKFEDTAMYKNVTTCIPGVFVMKLDENDALDVALIHGALKTRSPIAIRLLFSYALDEIFSVMKFPVEQITSNALNMVSMFGSVQGYSGTIDNVNILPREVVTGAYENNLINEKNNGGIALKLIKDSKRSDGKARNVYQISEADIKKPVKEIIQVMINGALNSEEERNSLSALIDTGAFFKNYKNKEISEAILDILKDRIDVVLYYDEDSNQVEFIKSTGDRSNVETGFISSTDPDSILKATQTDLSKRFTFYDQRHITGSDILQPKTAIALMTVGTRVLLRDILQGTLRMRQFMTSQKVYLVTSPSAAKFYNSKASHYLGDETPEVIVADVISLGAFNEDEKQLAENEKLAFVKIENEVRRFVLEEITSVILSVDETNNLDLLSILLVWFNVKKDGSKSVRDLFIRSIKENPLGWMVKLEKKESALVLKDYANFWIQKLLETAEPIDEISKDFSLNSSKRFDELKRVLEVMTEPTPQNSTSKDSLLEFLQSDITERKCEQAAGGEVEMQVFIQQLAELDIEKLIQTINGNHSVFERKKFKLKLLTNLINDRNLKDMMKDNYISLKSVLFDSSLDGDYKNMANAALITKGKRIGVSHDLVQLINIYPANPYKIFSRYTWEGSHILVQVLPGNRGIRAILLSVEAANEARNEMMSDDFESLTSKFWLCDLSGSISHTNDTESTKLMNILDFIPASRELFFDLLVFNGSFDHITMSKYMKEIFLNKWLKAANFQYRAMFLLTRMKVLAEKDEHIFSNDSYYMSLLNRAARGDKEIIKSTEKTSGSYKKAAVSAEMEAEFFAKSGIQRPKVRESSENSGVEVEETYFDITHLLAEDAGSVQIGRVIPLNPGTKIEVESNASNDIDNLLSKTRSAPILEVEGDPNDVNVVIEVPQLPIDANDSKIKSEPKFTENDINLIGPGHDGIDTPIVMDTPTSSNLSKLVDAPGTAVDGNNSKVKTQRKTTTTTPTTILIIIILLVSLSVAGYMFYREVLSDSGSDVKINQTSEEGTVPENAEINQNQE